MTVHPSPPVPPDVDLRDYPYMPVDIGRLFDSEFHAVSDDAAWRAGMTLWLKSYHQVPASSIPDDDVALARLAEFGKDMKGWRKIRSAALRGWKKCSDGRLYHFVVAEKALEGWIEKLNQRKSSGAGNAKQHKSQFDSTALDAAIEDCRDRLAALNPQSRLLKRRVKERAPIGNGSQSRDAERDCNGHPDFVQPGAPPGHPPDIPPGALDASHRGPKGREGKGKDIDNSQQRSPVAAGGAVLGYQQLEAALREAAGLENNPAAGLLVIGPISDLLDEGFDLDRHVLPVLRAKAAAGKFGRSWNFYVEAIRDARQKTGSPGSKPVPPGTDPRLIAGHPQELIFDLGGGFTCPLRNLENTLRLWRERGFWTAPTPAPGQAGCRIPDEFLPAEYHQKPVVG